MDSNRKERIGWYFYDWANSAYPLVINTAIFPIYYSLIARTNDSDFVQLFGMSFYNSALYSYAIAISFVCVSLLTPLLSGVADYSGRKKLFLRLFSTLGALSCATMFFFGSGSLEFGLLTVILASIGFSGSLVFYNAFLPEIAKPAEQDSVSARGFAMGYFGSSFLLIQNILLLTHPSWFGIETSGMTENDVFLMIAPWTFVLVAVWWMSFSQFTFAWLRERSIKRSDGNMFSSGFKELFKVWRELQKQPALKIFLAAFFSYSMGVQTVILVSSFFGKQVIGMSSGDLITVLLLLQFVAIGGSFLFSWLSKKLSNINALIIATLIWIAVCVGARFITTSTEYFVLSGFVGLVLGGIQSLSRSTYSKLLPATHDHASYFSFYDVCEKVGIVIGMFSYGWIADITGSMRNSVLAVISFFVVGLVLLIILKKKAQPSLAS